jgi:hypothetical protein
MTPAAFMIDSQFQQGMAMAQQAAMIETMGNPMGAAQNFDQAILWARLVQLSRRAVKGGIRPGAGSSAIPRTGAPGHCASHRRQSWLFR